MLIIVHQVNHIMEMLFEDVPTFPGIVDKIVDVLWELSLDVAKPSHDLCTRLTVGAMILGNLQ